MNLDALIADAMDDPALATPEEVAAKVAERTGSRDLRAAYQQTLLAYVRTRIAVRRQSNPVTGLRRVPDFGSRPRATADGFVSRRVKQIGDWHAELLVTRVALGGGLYKQLGDCTIADMMALAQRHQNLAGSHIALAERASLAADLIKKARGTTLSDVPAEQLSRAYAELGE